jgi:hypothetical protein
MMKEFRTTQKEKGLISQAFLYCRQPACNIPKQKGLSPRKLATLPTKPRRPISDDAGKTYYHLSNLYGIRLVVLAYRSNIRQRLKKQLALKPLLKE